jgi:hypothetical protein
MAVGRQAHVGSGLGPSGDRRACTGATARHFILPLPSLPACCRQLPSAIFNCWYEHTAYLDMAIARPCSSYSPPSAISSLFPPRSRRLPLVEQGCNGELEKLHKVYLLGRKEGEHTFELLEPRRQSLTSCLVNCSARVLQPTKSTHARTYCTS